MVLPKPPKGEALLLYSQEAGLLRAIWQLEDEERYADVDQTDDKEHDPPTLKRLVDVLNTERHQATDYLSEPKPAKPYAESRGSFLTLVPSRRDDD